MKKVLTQLCRGNLRPMERECICDSDRRHGEKTDRLYRELLSLLPEKHHDTLDELCTTISEISSDREDMLFCGGFRLGVRLASECFYGDEAP